MEDPEEGYISSEDSDFAPDGAERRDFSPSDSEDEVVEDAGVLKRKRQHADGEAEDAGFENSGDEDIIQKAENKKRRKRAKDPGRRAKDDEDGEQGGLIKTRSQRALEKAERKTFAASGPVTIDVDLLWAEMNRTTSHTSPNTSEGPKETEKTDTGSTVADSAVPGTATSENADNESSQMITIKRTYNFAGKIHTEEKLVPRDSAEAKLYLETLGVENADASDTTSEQPKRRPRKAFRSAFEPVPEQLLQRADLNLGIAARIRARELAQEAGAKKLSTVEKSRMDWAGYVDKEGIQDELRLAGKSKHSYAEREGFLARSEARREDDARRARLATRA